MHHEREVKDSRFRFYLAAMHQAQGSVHVHLLLPSTVMLTRVAYSCPANITFAHS